jgi:kynurenine formamidase
MKRTFAWGLLSCGLLAAVGLTLSYYVDVRPALGNDPPAVAGRGQRAGSAAEAISLAEVVAGKRKIVDLAWPINAQTAYWPGENYKPFALETIATLEKDGVLSKAFSMPEHLGTHLDAPNHFERQGVSVDRIPPEQLFAPAVKLDVGPAVSTDPDYRVTLDDVRRFETTHGPIPTGAVVLAYTGWSQYWGNPSRYVGKDALGRLHFPGFSAEAVQFLVDKRQIRGVGIDTMSVDYGLSRDFAVHHVLGKAGRWGLENVAHMNYLPASGFYLIVAPIKIETGSGGPARVFAILP